MISGCAARPPLMLCCNIFELIIWNPTQLVNPPVFSFRCPLCSRWIGYCISALLGCVCECKATVLYHIKSITLQLVCTLPTCSSLCLLCGQCLCSCGHLRVHCAIGQLEQEAKASLFLSLWLNENVSQCFQMLLSLPFIAGLWTVDTTTFWTCCFKQMMWRKGGGVDLTNILFKLTL